MPAGASSKWSRTQPVDWMLNVSLPALPSRYSLCSSPTVTLKTSSKLVPVTPNAQLFIGLATSTTVSVPAEPLSIVALLATPSIAAVMPASSVL